MKIRIIALLLLFVCFSCKGKDYNYECWDVLIETNIPTNINNISMIGAGESFACNLNYNNKTVEVFFKPIYFDSNKYDSNKFDAILSEFFADEKNKSRKKMSNIILGDISAYCFDSPDPDEEFLNQECLFVKKGYKFWIILSDKSGDNISNVIKSIKFKLSL